MAISCRRVSVVPGIGVGVMALFTRRMKRDANALLEPSAAAAPTSNGPVAEPPTARPSSVRTNARNAGRKRGGGATAVLLVAGVLATQGCDKIERARAERRGTRRRDGATERERCSEAPERTYRQNPSQPRPTRRSTLRSRRDHTTSRARRVRVDPFIAAPC